MTTKKSFKTKDKYDRTVAYSILDSHRCYVNDTPLYQLKFQSYHVPKEELILALQKVMFEIEDAS